MTFAPQFSYKFLPRALFFADLFHPLHTTGSKLRRFHLCGIQGKSKSCQMLEQSQDKVAIPEGCPCPWFFEVSEWLPLLLVLSLRTDEQVLLRYLSWGFQSCFLVGLTRSLLKPRQVFQLVLIAPITQCWRVLKCPPICCEQVCRSKTQVYCLWEKKASLEGKETFGVLLLSLCSIFLALVVCKHSHGCPLPDNPFRCTMIWREFLSICVALQSCF